jgi:hypothetical protein
LGCIAGELRRGPILGKTPNKALRKLQLMDYGENAGRCQMGCGRKRAPIMIGLAFGLMLGGQTTMAGGEIRRGVHLADDQRCTGLAIQVRHPARRQQGAQNHRSKREMNCQVAQIAGHVSSFASLMMEYVHRQCAMLAQQIDLDILELF